MNKIADKNSNTDGKIKIPKFLIIILLVIPLTVFLARFYTGKNLTSSDQLWSISFSLTYTGKKYESVLMLATPVSTKHNRVFSQNFSHHHSNIQYKKNKFSQGRVLYFLAESDGDLEINAEFLVKISEHPQFQFQYPLLSSNAIQHYLSDKPELDIDDHDLKTLAENLKQVSVDNERTINAIYQYTKGFKHKKNTTETRVASAILKSHSITVLERANLFIALSRALRIPARLVSGFILEEGSAQDIYHWVEVYSDGKWQSYDSYNGYRNIVPYNYIPFQYDSPDIFNIKHGNNLEAEFYIAEGSLNNQVVNGDIRSFSEIFNFSRLPYTTRESLSSLLLIPLAVLITVIFRQYIGIHNYGVFTPALLATAMTHNDLTITLITIIIVITFAFIGRSQFPDKMLRPPRLAIIITLVIFSMVYSVSFIDFYFPRPDEFTVLLPVIIMASLTDNFYHTYESLGQRTAFIRLFWTLVIAALCLPVMNWDVAGHFLVMYPETLIAVLAIILLVTGLSGKNLNRYIPALLKEPQIKKNTKTENQTGNEL